MPEAAPATGGDPSPAGELLGAHGVSALRGERLLFREVTLSLRPGELLQVHGPNGSGKTTLLRILCGLILPETGTVRWRGRSIHRLAAEYCAELLYVGHADAVKLDLSALENLRFARALGSAPGERSPEEAVRELGLTGLEQVRARSLSAGQRRRLALGRLLVSRATLWVLDEPFAALDGTGVQALEALLQGHLAAGGTAVFSSHQPHRLGGPALRELHLSPGAPP